jgi:hypothetical protein
MGDVWGEGARSASPFRVERDTHTTRHLGRPRLTTEQADASGNRDMSVIVRLVDPASPRRM